MALKHIYSGTSTVPEGVRVGELAALADMLALDGLKDVITLHLKAKMCHYFHKVRKDRIMVSLTRTVDRDDPDKNSIIKAFQDYSSILTLESQKARVN